MKSLFIFILIVFVSLKGAAQGNQSGESRISYAERMLKVYFTSVEFTDKLDSIYSITPIQFRIKNRTFLHSISGELIEAYDNHSFDLDSLDSFIFNQFLENETALNFINVNTQVPHTGPILQNRAAGDPCTNMDFETGDLTGWEMFEGDVNGNISEMVNSVQIAVPGAHHTIMAPGTDPIVPIPTTSPNGGVSSLRLGDGTGAGGKAASVRQTFLVDASNAVFTYSYACVLEDPSGHSGGEKPFFKVNIYDDNGNSIPCGEYSVVAGSSLDGTWVSYGGGFYKDWSTVFAPLDAYIGTNVTIEFISGDCDQGGHYGYAYVDAECSPLELIAPGVLICDGNPVDLNAPVGAASYNWNTGATTSSISTSTPGNYSVDVVPIQGATCAITLTATVSGATGSPTAAYTAVPTTICTGETVTFTDNSSVSPGSTLDYWDWNFDDGSANENSQNTTHQFANAGTYDVELVSGVLVPGQGGCFDTTMQTISVVTGPVADFTSSFECEGTVTQFTDLSTIATGAITTWRWDFTNDGSVENVTQNPINGYPSSGTFMTELYVANVAGCADSVVLPVVVNPVPVSHFNHLDQCQGVALNFMDSSYIASGAITNWQWDFGDLVGSSNLQNDTYTYAVPGTYSTVLTVTSDSGCIDNAVIPTSMFADPIADMNFVNGCDGAAVNFSDNSNANGSTLSVWEYDFDNNAVVDYFGAGTAYNYSSPGTYSVHFYVETIDGCSHDTIKTIEIHPNPVASFTGQNVCEGNTVTFTNTSIIAQGTVDSYAWQFGNGNTSILENPVELYANEGVPLVELSVTSDSGCVNTVTQPIEIYPTPSPLFITSNVCDGQQADFSDFSQVSNQFTPNNIVNWNWDFGVMPIATGTGQFTNYTYPSAATYNVTLDIVTNNGCVNSYSAPVTVNPNPIVSFTSVNPDGCSTWCPDFTNASTLASGVISQYLWNLGDGTVSTDPNPSHCYTNVSALTESYDISLTATSDQGCVTSMTENAFVNIFPIPLADFTFSPDPIDIYNTEVTFTNTSIIADASTWDFAGLDNSSDTDPVFTFPDHDAGEYLVCLDVVSAEGCIHDTCKTVVIDGFSNLYIPSAFTPDGDGVNDYFTPSLYGFSETGYKFQIFDRWGLLIYETEDLNGVWDGTYLSLPSQQDIYIWKVEAVDKYTNEVIEKIGHVTLIK